MIPTVFKGLCPNCGGDITSERLELGIPCESCMPDPHGPLLKEGFLSYLKEVNEKERAWIEHFRKCIGAQPWSLQIAWARRVFLGRSFALLAPTGVGKTSFGLSIASFLARENKRSYIILPTKLLVEQTKQKLLSFGIKESDMLVFGEEEKYKKEKKELLEKADFKILISTSMFLYKNYEIIPRNFYFIFVDDVDSFLKTAKNIDKALYLLGFSENQIQMAMELIRLKEKNEKTPQYWQKIKEVSEMLKMASKDINGILVVSSATSNPRSNRVKLFRELLGFEVGVPIFYLRNILDTFCDYNTNLPNLIQKLGKGGLVFVSSDQGKEGVEEVVNMLKSQGIEAVSYEDLGEEEIKQFEEGKIWVIVGIASYRNPLARGFDLPHVVRYSLFYGVPKIVISLKFEKNLSHLLWALVSIRPLIAKKLPSHISKLDRWIAQIKRYQYLSEEFILEKPSLLKTVEGLKNELHLFFASSEVLKILQESEEVTLRKTEDGFILVVSDATGYLQASGRTSRMYAGGITKGLSIVMVDDKIAFNHLQKKIRWFSEDIKFVNLEEINLEEILREIDEDRERVKEVRQGKARTEEKELLKPVLIVVESPNKARTIANFFGKAIRRKIGEHELLETSVEDRYLMISASLGHILDLTTKEKGYYGVLIDGNIIPIYEPIPGKERIIESLKRMAQESFEVLIATDPDTEGEKIGWDLKELLRPFVSNIKRMEFHEVTKKAILNALKAPREFNENLVKAQIVRRVADRWVGFEFSQLLWEAFKNQLLSAGRVQTPVLGWIIAREKEYRKKIYKVLLNIRRDGRKLWIDFTFEDKEKALKFFETLKEIKIEVLNITEEPRFPPPPFSTDTLLKEAHEKYRFTLPLTMELAQTLFELGYITYHRTDSTRVSDVGINVAKEYIKEEFGSDFFVPRTWGEKGAHECIRPTKNMDPEELNALILSGQVEGLSRNHLLLYDLIFRRFIASQMREVKVKVAHVLLKANEEEKRLTLNWDILQEGWNKLLPLELHPIVEGKWVVTEDNKRLKIQPKAYLYTQGELVQEMKIKGIGRPSTYATILEKLLERGYVIDRKGFLIPTKLGKEVYNYLQSRQEVRSFLSEEFTRDLEHLMDEVENSKEDYQKVLRYLHSQITQARQIG
jgi:reverse gyrase